MYWAKPRAVSIRTRSMDELEHWIEMLRDLANARAVGALDPTEEFLTLSRIPYSPNEVFAEFRRRGGI